MAGSLRREFPESRYVRVRVDPATRDGSHHALSLCADILILNGGAESGHNPHETKAHSGFVPKPTQSRGRKGDAADGIGPRFLAPCATASRRRHVHRFFAMGENGAKMDVADSTRDSGLGCWFLLAPL
jgi:hypothetical protein